MSKYSWEKVSLGTATHTVAYGKYQLIIGTFIFTIGAQDTADYIYTVKFTVEFVCCCLL